VHGSQFDKLTVTSLTMTFFCHPEPVEGWSGRRRGAA